MWNKFFTRWKKKGKVRFANSHINNIRRKAVDIFLWQIGYYNDKFLIVPPPYSFSYPNPKETLTKNSPEVTWINHCTFLLAIDGVHILTDPIWSKRCSPFHFFGPKRKHNPPISIEELPSIDFVFISHNHYDHLDKKSVLKLHKLYPNITWIVPLGVKKWFKDRGISQVRELSWWEETLISDPKHPEIELKVTAVPAQHYSGRGIFDKNRSLWVGFVIDCIREKKGNKRFYFVGDTGYNEKDFNAIGEKFGEMDLSLIPIGTYIPHKFMDPVHIDPEKATAIHKEVKSRLSVGMHWRTFRLSGETLERPPYDLFLALQKEGLDPSTFRILEPGQTIHW